MMKTLKLKSSPGGKLPESEGNAVDGVSVSSTVRQGDYVTITNVVTSPYKRGNIPLNTEGNIDWK